MDDALRPLLVLLRVPRTGDETAQGLALDPRTTAALLTEAVKRGWIESVSISRATAGAKGPPELHWRLTAAGGEALRSNR